MTLALKNAGRIRSDLQRILSDGHTDVEINSVVELYHAFAVASVKRKIAARTLSERFIGLNSGDIAYDCIVELFQRDESGRFVQMKAYFDGITLGDISNEELLTHSRRLVFSKVSDRLFRIYRETDPSLAKIIHNIKVVVSTLHSFDEVERLGENCICPSFVERLEEFPAIDRDTIEREMRKRVRGTERIPELMAELSLFLRQQGEYCRVVPIVGVALVFRSIYNEPMNDTITEPAVESAILMKDARRMIKEACREVKAEMEPTYVGKKKVSTEHMNFYFFVIEETLTRRFADEDERDGSLFEHLKEYIPDLEREEYKRSHKKTLEYLLRLSTESAKKKLQSLYR